MVCKLLSHGGEILIPDRLLVSSIVIDSNPGMEIDSGGPQVGRPRPARKSFLVLDVPDF